MQEAIAQSGESLTSLSSAIRSRFGESRAERMALPTAESDLSDSTAVEDVNCLVESLLAPTGPFPTRASTASP